MHDWFDNKKDSISNSIDQYAENKTWVQKLKDILRRFRSLEITRSSAAASYYFIFSLFPLILFTISLFNLINPELTSRVLLALPELEPLIPEPVMQTIINFVRAVADSNSVSIISFSGIGLLWSASGALGNVINSLNRIYHREKKHFSYFIGRVMGMLGALLFGVVLIAILLFLSFSRIVLRWLKNFIILPESLTRGDFNISAYFISFVALFLLFTSIYAIFAKGKGRLAFTVISACFTALAWLIISFTIANIIVKSPRYDVIYGSLANIIFLMLWIFFAVLTVMIGAFIHSELILYYYSPQIITYKSADTVNSKVEQSEVIGEAKSNLADIGTKGTERDTKIKPAEKVAEVTSHREKEELEQEAGQKSALKSEIKAETDAGTTD